MRYFTEVEWNPDGWLEAAVIVVVTLFGVAAALLAIRLIVAGIRKRTPWIGELFARIRPRLELLVIVIALWVASSLTVLVEQGWWPVASRTLLVSSIIISAWLLTGMASFGLERILVRYDTDVVGKSPEIRRKRTQLTMIRRLVTALISVVAVGATIFTFPEVRAVGASVMASAGIVSIIAGLAAQSTLGNLVAGVQLAFSDAVRVGDVVVVEDEWGTIGEITLTYVVVYIWDERRLVLPSTYFTSQPFENWTRRSDKVLGTVYMDLDWQVPIEQVRSKFMAIVETAEEWDGRAASVLVTDATGGYVNVRFLISARNSGDQWVLRCKVREAMVTWLQHTHPESLPVTRVSLTSEPEVSSPRT